jgi:DNA-binding transcriptional MerR regulator
MHSTRAFILLTGSTTKLLQHYERLGLLAPQRTTAGYRRYSPADLGRVHQLLAVKSLGLSLQTIKSLLDGDRIDIASHCARLSREREELTRAIDALSQLPAQAQGVTAFNHFVPEFTWERAEAMRQRFAANTPLVPARGCESRLASFHALARALRSIPAARRRARWVWHFESSRDAAANGVAFTDSRPPRAHPRTS